MDYDNGFILQKAMVSTNRSLDWSLLRSSYARLPLGFAAFYRRDERTEGTQERGGDSLCYLLLFFIDPL